MNVLFSEKAQKQYDRLNEFMKVRIAAAVKKLEAEPPQGDIIKLRDQSGYRVRVGGYRVLFEITNTAILVYKIETRGDVYKRG